MKTNKILAITLSLPLSFCSISCSNSLPKKIDMSSYSISEGSTLYNQKLCRISTPIIDGQGFSGISFKTPDWSFSTMTVSLRAIVLLIEMNYIHLQQDLTVKLSLTRNHIVA